MIKNKEQGNCYVVPVGTNKTAGQELGNFVKGYHGQEINVQQGKSYTVNLLPGVIEDTSFLPPEAQAECSSFQWLTVVDKGK